MIYEKDKDYGYEKCNGCYLARLKKQWGNRLVKVGDSYYLAGMKPSPGQAEPTHLPNGIPIQFVIWFMGEGHDHTPSQADMLIEDELEIHDGLTFRDVFGYDVGDKD